MKHKRELALKHLAMVALEVRKIKELYSQADLDTVVQELDTIGLQLSLQQALEEADFEPLPWEDRLKGAPRRKLVGYKEVRIIPPQKVLREARKLYEEGSLTEKELEERIQVLKEMKAVYQDTPSLPYQTLCSLPKNENRERKYPSGCFSLCGSFTCEGQCFK